jgi:hypothetical protein
MKRNLLILVSIPIIVGAIVMSINADQEYDFLKSHGKYSACKIEVRGSDIECHFTLDKVGETSKRMTKPHAYIFEGESYRVYYHDSIEGRYYIAFDKPIIDTSQFSTSSGVIESWKEGGVMFNYEIDGFQYDRFQHISSDMTFSNNQTVPILYKLDNPGIAYLIQ